MTFSSQNSTFLYIFVSQSCWKLFDLPFQSIELNQKMSLFNGRFNRLKSFESDAVFPYIAMAF